MSAFKDLTGQTFGQLLVLEQDGFYVPPGGSGRAPKWKCLCSCGNTKSILRASLVGRRTLSCGCLQKRRASERGACTRPDLWLPKGEAGFNILLSRYKLSARKRDIGWHLSVDQFRELTKQNCHYCGVEPEQVATGVVRSDEGRARKSYIYNGVDRMDNNLGYLANNCVACCSTCNFAKNDMHYAQFLCWLVRAGATTAKQLIKIDNSEGAEK